MEPAKSEFCKGFSYLTTAIVSIILIITYTIYVIARASNGDTFTKGDIVCAAILISFGTVILIVMLVCLCLETKFCLHKERVITVSRLKKISASKDNEVCAICLDDKNPQKMTVVALTCNHTFHKKCVKEWLIHKTPPNCPECRQPSKKFPAMSRISDLLRSLTSKDMKTKQDPETFV